MDSGSPFTSEAPVSRKFTAATPFSSIASVSAPPIVGAEFSVMVRLTPCWMKTRVPELCRYSSKICGPTPGMVCVPTRTQVLLTVTVSFAWPST